MVVHFHEDGTHGLDSGLVVDEDIAHALAHTYRWAATIPVTVAEHCWRTSFVGDEHHLAKLIHDFHEYLVGDVPTPVKIALGERFAALEDSLHAVLSQHYGSPWPPPPCVADADRLLAMTEARDFRKVTSGALPGPTLPTRIVPMPPRLAKALLLARLDELRGRATWRRRWLGLVPSLQWVSWRIRSFIFRKPVR